MSAFVTSKPTRKSHGSSRSRFAASGISQTHAGSSTNARASTSLASPRRSRPMRTTSTRATLTARRAAHEPPPGSLTRWSRRPPGGSRHRPPTSGGFDLHDLELQRTAGSGHLDHVALLVAHDRLADGRLVRQLVLGRVGLGRAHDVVLEGLVGLHVPQADVRADGDRVLQDLLLRDHAGSEQPVLELGDLVVEHGLLVLGVVVLRVLGDVAELACDADALGDLAALLAPQKVDLLLEFLVALGCEDDFLQNKVLLTPEIGREW